MRPSIVRCGQQLLAFHHLASTSSFSHHASLLLLGLSYRWSGYSHIENLFCSQEQWDAGCDLKFGNLKREACREKTVWRSCRKKSKVKIMKILGKNMMLRRHTGLSSVYKFSQHFWFMCIRSGLFGWLHLCRSWGFDKHLDKFEWVWPTVLQNLTLFQEEAWFRIQGNKYWSLNVNGVHFHSCFQRFVFLHCSSLYDLLSFPNTNLPLLKTCASAPRQK